MPSEKVDIQIIKEYRGIPYVVEPYDKWLERIIKLKQKEKNNGNVNGSSRKRTTKKRRV